MPKYKFIPSKDYNNGWCLWKDINFPPIEFNLSSGFTGQASKEYEFYRTYWPKKLMEQKLKINGIDNARFNVSDIEKYFIIIIIMGIVRFTTYFTLPVKRCEDEHDLWSCKY